MTQARKRPIPTWGLATLGLTIALAAMWLLWPRSPVLLSEQGYDFTLALYRICNQRSGDGLARAEAQWAIAKRETPQSPSSERAVDEIIWLAKSGNWQDASVRCRQALEDQVR